MFGEFLDWFVYGAVANELEEEDEESAEILY